jgi:hypothetical protein
MKKFHDTKEAGIALISVAGAIIILAALGFGLIVIVNNTVQKVYEYRQYQKALNLADAGIDHVTWLYKNNAIPDSYYNNVITFDFGAEGQCKFKIVEGSLGFEKVVYSVGITPNGIKKAVKVNLFAMNIWDLLLSAGNQNPDRRPGGSGGIAGNGAVIGPLYVRGGLPNLSGTFDIYEGPLFIKNGILAKSSSAGNVGTSSQPIKAYIDGNEYGAVFRRRGSTLEPIDPWSPGLNIYINSLSRRVPDIEFPALTPEELQKKKQQAQSEASDSKLPSYPQSASKVYYDENLITAQTKAVLGIAGMTSYKVIDNNDAIDGSLGTFTLNSQKFGFVDANKDGFINNLDYQYLEFAFDGTTNPKLLIINGTVFVDGDLTLNGPIIYSGKGTFIVNGNFRLNNTLLAYANYPQTNALGIAVKRDTYFAVQSSNDDIDDIQIALYTEGDVIFYNTDTKFFGALIAGFIDMTSANNIKIVLADALPDNLPPSLPASESNIVTVTGWKEIAVPPNF